MNYPTNHPFSPRYVSQIPVTDSDRRSTNARNYILRMQEEGKPNASKQTFGAIGQAEAARINFVRGQCPACSGDIVHATRRRKTIALNVRVYVCRTCADSIDRNKGSA